MLPFYLLLLLRRLVYRLIIPIHFYYLYECRRKLLNYGKLNYKKLRTFLKSYDFPFRLLPIEYTTGLSTYCIPTIVLGVA